MLGTPPQRAEIQSTETILPNSQSAESLKDSKSQCVESLKSRNLNILIAQSAEIFARASNYELVIEATRVINHSFNAKFDLMLKFPLFYILHVISKGKTAFESHPGLRALLDKHFGQLKS